MSDYKSTGVRYGKHSKRYLKEVGGLRFLDTLNDALLTVTSAQASDNCYGTLDLGNGLVLQGLGSGLFRSAYRYKNIVIKFTRGRMVADSVNEWEVYQEAMKTGMHKHLSACIAILDWPYGTVTVYEYIDGVENRENVRKVSRGLSAKLYKAGSKLVAFDLHGGNIRGSKVIDYGLFEGVEEATQATLRQVLPQNKYVVRE